MSISIEDIIYIANLARIELSEGELQKFRTDLNKVLGYVEVLKTVNTDSVEPLATVTGLENVFREDKVEDSEVQEDILQNAPERKGKFIKVKKVF
ncbi:MAG: Asp-tRNA(Asn)/Glu-tRNA(Gln) amidotransferase subunit GatC [bacterium]|nr:Asp-tRNA(Asn)/Glu-tRNA(Gln) amidotransferase subunit GatC [bacterium]